MPAVETQGGTTLVSAMPRHQPSPADAAGLLTLEEVYRLHARAVARWAERLGGPRGDQEEIVQGVLLIVDRRLAEFRGEAKLTTWLFRITTRVVANHRRRVRRRGLWARLTRRIEEITPAPTGCPGDGLEGREAVIRFHKTLDGLADRYREVLVMFELEEMPTDEIARVLERPPATVRVWLRRARAEFTRRWDDLCRQEDTV